MAELTRGGRNSRLKDGPKRTKIFNYGSKGKKGPNLSEILQWLWSTIIKVKSQIGQGGRPYTFLEIFCPKIGRATKFWWGRAMFFLTRHAICTGGAYKDGPENLVCISGRARKVWTALIGRALQKQNKKDKSGRATHISDPSLYAPPLV